MIINFTTGNSTLRGRVDVLSWNNPEIASAITELFNLRKDESIAEVEVSRDGIRARINTEAQ